MNTNLNSSENGYQTPLRTGPWLRSPLRWTPLRMTPGHPLEQPRFVLSHWPSHSDSEHGQKAEQSPERGKTKSPGHTRTETKGQTPKTAPPLAAPPLVLYWSPVVCCTKIIVFKVTLQSQVCRHMPVIPGHKRITSLKPIGTPREILSCTCIVYRER